MRHRTKGGLVGLLVLAICCVMVIPALAGTIYDKFDNNYINPEFWGVDILGTGPTVNEANGRLEITFPADSSGTSLMAGVKTNFKIVGDFDTQVDFNLLTWPAENGFNVSITTGVNFMISRYSYDFWDGEGYLLNHGGNMISVPATGTSGKLRLKRTGTTMEAFYWQNDAWQSMGAFSDDQFAAETGVFLSSDCGNPSRFTGQLVQVGFDNFQVTNQYLGPRGSLNFLQLLLG